MTGCEDSHKRHVVGIIQARMGSTRLPGKVMKPLLGEAILSHVVRRVERSRLVDTAMVATSCAAGDQVIEELCANLGVMCFRGSEEDVLDRYVEAARTAGVEPGDHVVRITADCPFVDPVIVDQVVEEHVSSGADYSSNTLQRTFPRGADVEVITVETLFLAGAEATEVYEREHVTPFVWRQPQRFRLHNVEAPEHLRRPDLRLTVDTEADYMLATAIYETLGRPDFGLEEVVGLLDRSPWLAYINRTVRQKPVKTTSDPRQARILEYVEAARWSFSQELFYAAAVLVRQARSDQAEQEPESREIWDQEDPAGLQQAIEAIETRLRGIEP